jgi:hypothetical protein
MRKHLYYKPRDLIKNYLHFSLQWALSSCFFQHERTEKIERLHYEPRFKLRTIIRLRHEEIVEM